MQNLFIFVLVLSIKAVVGENILSVLRHDFYVLHIHSFKPVSSSAGSSYCLVTYSLKTWTRWVSNTNTSQIFAFLKNVSRCTEKKTLTRLQSNMYLDIVEWVKVDISVLKAVFNTQKIINAYIVMNNNIYSAVLLYNTPSSLQHSPQAESLKS